jgi:hypothetical protein
MSVRIVEFALIAAVAIVVVRFAIWPLLQWVGQFFPSQQVNANKARRAAQVVDKEDELQTREALVGLKKREAQIRRMESEPEPGKEQPDGKEI